MPDLFRCSVEVYIQLVMLYAIEMLQHLHNSSQLRCVGYQSSYDGVMCGVKCGGIMIHGPDCRMW
jgi:hypothetical protein